MKVFSRVADKKARLQVTSPCRRNVAYRQRLKHNKMQEIGKNASGYIKSPSLAS